MKGYKIPNLDTRQRDAAAAKKAQLLKVRAASADPAIKERATARVALNEARQVRAAAKKLRAAKQAEEDALKAELALQAKREADAAEVVRAADMAEREVALAAEQKSRRDARYAARKAAGKQRRKG